MGNRKLKYVTLEEQDARWRRARALELSDQHVDVESICERLGMGESAVRQLLQRHGRSSKPKTRPDKRWTEAEFGEAKKLKRIGLSHNQVGRALGRTRGSVAGKLWHA
jgi:hypothetical protein